ncbi:MAG: hypothetical protein Ct9H300mP28_25100 [Pseudomonadota bacterium]|nr:MAG: hypothetical protein Ct9H300mP28_25100 [Pseudomonadota bacterium]
MSEHTYTNKLIHEKSPYLFQHAHNPVDWYPWGSEAFEKGPDVKIRCCLSASVLPPVTGVM